MELHTGPYLGVLKDRRIHEPHTMSRPVTNKGNFLIYLIIYLELVKSTNNCTLVLRLENYLSSSVIRKDYNRVVHTVRSILSLT